MSTLRRLWWWFLYHPEFQYMLAAMNLVAGVAALISGNAWGLVSIALFVFMRHIAEARLKVMIKGCIAGYLAAKAYREIARMAETDEEVEHEIK